MAYTPELKQFVDLAFERGSLSENWTWEHLFNDINHHDGKLLKTGYYAEFLPYVNAKARHASEKYDSHSDHTLLQILQTHIEADLLDTRYLNGADYLLGTTRPEDCDLCPKTGRKVKPITVSKAVVETLEKIWEMNSVRPYYKGGFIEQFGEMEPTRIPGWCLGELMACLLRLSWHLTCAGVEGVTPFEQRWEDAKVWKQDSMGARTLRDFLSPGLWSQDCPIQPWITASEIQRLYKDGWDYFDQLIAANELDPRLDERRGGKFHPKIRVAQQVAWHFFGQVKEGAKHFPVLTTLDDEFMQPFIEFQKQWTEDHRSKS